jgi:diguanylate cyclase (GGDEF)-like protein
MSDHDLFQAEEAALAKAVAMHARTDADSATYRAELGELIGRYERLMREMRRLIRHGDRQERELNELNAHLRVLAERLDYKARHDALTGELNRAAVIELVTEQLRTKALSLVVLDIDHFKRINDSFGHPTGDAVIIELVKRLRNALPPEAQLGRVGGEEFTVVLPELDLVAAGAAAEQMRGAVAATPFECASSRQVTASFGVSWSASGSSFDQAYARADEALYAAKRGGRNRVELAAPAAPTD